MVTTVSRDSRRLIVFLKKNLGRRFQFFCPAMYDMPPLQDAALYQVLGSVTLVRVNATLVRVGSDAIARSVGQCTSGKVKC